MCGRVVTTTPLSVLAEQLEAKVADSEAARVEPSWNAAPTALLPVLAEARSDHTRRIGYLRWGLVPWWAQNPSVAGKFINARAETLSSKPAFRDAFDRRRCLIVVDGFYEWRGGDGRRQPYLIRATDGSPLTFAGLWERWHPPDQPDVEPLRTCTIVTTKANEVVARIHDRMPAILAPEERDIWLDPDSDAEELRPLLVRAPTTRVAAYPVSTRVNRVTNNGPDLAAPLGSELV